MKFVKEWIAIIALFAAVGGPLTAWGATQARLQEVEKKVDNADSAMAVLSEHKAVIPIIQRDIEALKQDFKEVRTDIKQILQAVKS